MYYLPRYYLTVQVPGTCLVLVQVPVWQGKTKALATDGKHITKEESFYTVAFWLVREAMIDNSYNDRQRASPDPYGQTIGNDVLLSHGFVNQPADRIEHCDAVKTHLKMLMQKESQYRPCLNYFLKSPNEEPTGDDPETVSETWRLKVCEWCYQVVDHYNFNREVVFIAMNYLDRVVALETMKSSCSINKKDFRLMAITALYMAIKLHGIHLSNDSVRRKLRIVSFCDLSERCFSVEQIEAMERRILSGLAWLVNPPTPFSYVDSLVSLCPLCNISYSGLSHGTVSSSIRDFALYLTELAVSESRFTFSSSCLLLSYSAVLCAISSLHSSSCLPLEIKTAFCANMEEAVHLSPQDQEVVMIISCLQDICPCENMFADIEESEDDEELSNINGKISPVSVMDAAPYTIDHDIGRKRFKRDSC